MHTQPGPTGHPTPTLISQAPVIPEVSKQKKKPKNEQTGTHGRAVLEQVGQTARLDGSEGGA
eukprot:6529688-Prorocentrum_lima.AAC.1